MDIKAIDTVIKELEDSDTTADNVQELSSLYIVKEYLQKHNNNVEKELNDILPAYNEYVDCKRNYQLHKGNIDSMLFCFKILCQEVEEFVYSIYSGTCTGKERRYFNTMLSNLEERLKIEK